MSQSCPRHQGIELHPAYRYFWIFGIVIALSSGVSKGLQWDPTGDMPIGPPAGSGYWDTTTHANWSNGTSNSTWVNGQAAFFPLGDSSAATVTIDDSSGTVIAEQIILNPNYTVAAIPGDTLTFQGPGPGGIIGAGTISAPIAGTVGVQTENAPTLSGQSTYTGPTEILDTLTLANGASLNNTGVGGNTLAVKGSVQIGTTGPGTAGGSIGSNPPQEYQGIKNINMIDGTIGTLTFNQESGYTGTSFQLSGIGTTLGFDLGQTSADEIIDVGPGTGSLGGGHPTINISLTGDAYLTPGQYTLISIPAGGMQAPPPRGVAGTFWFSDGMTTESEMVGGTNYGLSIATTDTAAVLTVTVLPEPTGLAMLVLSAAFLLRRRPPVCES